MLGVQRAKTGDWILCFAQVPGQAPQPAGIFLFDSVEDKLYLRLRKDLESSDPDFMEVWREMADGLQQFAEDLGGAACLRLLEDVASHTFTLGPRHTITMQSPEWALKHLFESQVLTHSLVLPAAVPIFRDEDLIAVRKRLPTSPNHALQIIAALKNPNVKFTRVEEFVSQDPSLAAHLLRLANSPLFYAGGEIRTVTRAILHIGLDRTVRHLSALVLRRLFSLPTLHQVWNHSITAAHLNHQLGQLCTYPEPDELLLLGLVHDIGQIALSALDEPFHEAYRALSQQEIYAVEIERRLCGKSHAEIGADLLEAWSFPREMVEAVRFHHVPSRSVLPTTALLYITESWMESKEDIYNPAEHRAALDLLRLSNRDLVRLNKTLDPEFALLRFAA